LGARTGVFSNRTPIAVTARSKSLEKMLSRSWSRNRFLLQRLAELLQRPFSTRMRRHIEVQDPTPAQFHDHEYIKDTESAVNTTKKSHATIAWA